MSQSLSRRSFLKCAGSGAVSLAAALLTGVSAAALAPCYEGEPALLDGKAAVELLGYAPAPELGSTLVYLSVENLSAKALAVGTSYLQSRDMTTTDQLYRLGTGLTAVCDGKAVRCGSFAAPLYGENAADASAFTLNLAAGRGAMLHCFCETPEDWKEILELETEAIRELLKFVGKGLLSGIIRIHGKIEAVTLGEFARTNSKETVLVHVEKADDRIRIFRERIR